MACLAFGLSNTPKLIPSYSNVSVEAVLAQAFEELMCEIEVIEHEKRRAARNERQRARRLRKKLDAMLPAGSPHSAKEARL